jgi:hypothetical protein
VSKNTHAYVFAPLIVPLPNQEEIEIQDKQNHYFIAQANLTTNKVGIFDPFQPQGPVRDMKWGNFTTVQGMMNVSTRLVFQ